ncbi:hypothetical protein JTE90_028009 [Oedothorax gibbosus]|uniref:Splicing factor 3B subunit 6 n=1 Tax=Oedothorax gibbosus TaxID=931172 RepID=A0AAV6VDI3_9ARAC|nr:hypothetical protein JTE90_028009 [Oedothorax gibbosus]
MAMQRKTNVRLPPEVNRILYVRNLPYKITAEEMYDIFGKYGAIRQIRVGNTPETRGTAFVVYEDIFDAKNACDHLSGFNVCNRYLVVLYYQSNKSVWLEANNPVSSSLQLLSPFLPVRRLVKPVTSLLQLESKRIGFLSCICALTLFPPAS